MKHPHQQEPPLLFDWDRREHTTTWFLVWLLITGLGFASLFIVFRIVTPEATKLSARAQQMMVLNPAVPAERALINRAMDFSFTLLPSEVSIKPEVPPAAKLPDFSAALSRFELKLKAPNASLVTRERPRLFAQDIDVLPPLSAVVLPRKPEQASKLHVKLSGGLADRLISDVTLRDIPLSDSARPTFRIAVGNLGQVLMALPLHASDDPAIMVKLHAALTQMRFKPDGKDVEWAQVGFAWEKESTP